MKNNVPLSYPANTHSYLKQVLENDYAYPPSRTRIHIDIDGGLDIGVDYYITYMDPKKDPCSPMTCKLCERNFKYKSLSAHLLSKRHKKRLRAHSSIL